MLRSYRAPLHTEPVVDLPQLTGPYDASTCDEEQRSTSRVYQRRSSGEYFTCGVAHHEMLAQESGIFRHARYAMQAE